MRINEDYLDKVVNDVSLDDEDEVRSGYANQKEYWEAVEDVYDFNFVYDVNINDQELSYDEMIKYAKRSIKKFIRIYNIYESLLDLSDYYIELRQSEESSRTNEFDEIYEMYKDKAYLIRENRKYDTVSIAFGFNYPTTDLKTFLSFYADITFCHKTTDNNEHFDMTAWEGWDNVGYMVRATYIHTARKILYDPEFYKRKKDGELPIDNLGSVFYNEHICSEMPFVKNNPDKDEDELIVRELERICREKGKRCNYGLEEIK